MKYNQLSYTDLHVSAICLGTMTFGQQNTEKEAHEQLDYAISQGINFIDTAEMYSIPPRKETQGNTERYIGTWLQKQKKREDLILATKAVGPGEYFSYMRGGPNYSSEQLNEAVNNSLKRLQTDYIDIYQLHWPERQTNYFGRLNYQHNPEDKWENNIHEVLDTLNELIDAGKIRYIGLSNETPWGLMSFLKVAEMHDLPHVVSVQNPYNLLNRSYEIGMAEISIREKAGLLAYSPLGFGVLSGKYYKGAQPQNTRLSMFKQYARYTNPQAVRAADMYTDLARKHGLTPAQMALAFINSQPFVTANIIGATSIEQLKENISSIDITLSKELIKEIEAIHTEQPNPAP